MADINVNVVLPDPISVDVTSPTQAIATNISVPGPQGPAGPKGFNPLINGISGDSILFSGRDGIIISSDQSINTIYVSGNSGYFESAINTLTNNLNLTGTNLNTSINNLSGLFTGYTGNLDNNYATDAQLASTGNILNNNINSLSGTLTSNYATITNLASTGSTLVSSINSLNSDFTGFTGNLDATYATDSQLATTGSTLNTRINNLSGYINSSSSNILFTTGNQIKSGRLIIGNDAGSIVDPNSEYTLSLQTNSPRTWLEILNNSGANKGVFFGIEGNDFEQYNWQAGDIKFFTSENFSDGTERLRIKNDGKVGIGTSSPSEKLEVVGNILANNLVYNTGNQIISGNKTFDLAPIVSGNPLITGNLSLYATTINLATTGSTLDNKINSLSGASVLTYGSQSISGIKTFSGQGVVVNFTSGASLLVSGVPVLTGIVGTGNFITLDQLNQSQRNIYISSNGNDSTAQIGNINRPYLTAQAAFNAAILDGSNQYILNFYAGNWTINTASTFNWPITLGVRGIGPTSSSTEAKPTLTITHSVVGSLANPGPNRTIVDFGYHSIILSIESRGGSYGGGLSMNGGAGGNITLYNAIGSTISSFGGPGGPGVGNVGGVGGNINLYNCEITTEIISEGGFNGNATIKAFGGNVYAESSRINSINVPYSISNPNPTNTITLIDCIYNPTTSLIKNITLRNSYEISAAKSTLSSSQNLTAGFLHDFSISNNNLSGILNNLTLHDNQIRPHLTGRNHALTIDFASGIYVNNSDIYGNLRFNNSIIFSGNDAFLNFTSGARLLISGNPVLTGVDLSSYATTSNLATTGSTLATNLALTGSNLNVRINTLTSNLATTGSTLDNRIDSLSGYVNSQDTTVLNNLNTTGSTLDQKINSLSGSSVLLYGDQTIDGIKTFRDKVYIHDLYVTGEEFIANVTNNFIESSYILLNLTGGATDGGIFFVTGSGLTGINDLGPIIGFDHTDKFKFGISSRGSDLSTLNDIAAVQDITAYSGFVNGKYATIINLTSTGSTLDTKIDTLSGYANNTFSTITNLASTGNILDSKINALSGSAVLLYGNQIISGTKTFVDNQIFNQNINISGTGVFNALDLNNIDQLSLSGIDISITGSTVNVYGNILISGNPVLTGVDLSSYATTANLASTGSTLTSNLASTGSTLNTKIDNLSGYVNSSNSNIVFTTGDQNINGTKIFNENISGRFISGTYINAGLTSAWDSGPRNGYFLGNGHSIRAVDTSNGIGFYSAVNSYPRFLMAASTLRMGANGALLWNTTNDVVTPTSTTDVGIYRDAANILGQRNGTNPQQLRIYNSTGTNSGEFGLFGWQNNNLIIGSQATSSGILRDIILTGNRVISTVPLIISGADLSGINTNGTQGFRLTSRALGLLGDSLQTVLVNEGYGGITQLGTDGNTTLRIQRGDNSSAVLPNNTSLGWHKPSPSNVAEVPDVRLWRDGSGILSLRSDNISRGTNFYITPSGMQFRVFNITGTNTGEFGLFGWQNSQLILGSQQSQSGTLRDVVITGNNININGAGVFNVFDNTNIVGNLNVTGNILLSGNQVLTGSSTLYATSANLASTGSTLDTKVNALSGSAVLLYGDQTINGTKTFTTRPTVNGTGILLSGEAASLPTTIVYTTGNQNIGGNKTFTGVTTFSGQEVNLVDTALNLSGVGDMTFTSTNINFISSPFYISGANLRVDGNILLSGNPVLTGVNLSSYATISNLASTGSTLDSKINTLSGYGNNTFSTIANLALSGSSLDTKINTLSGSAVLLYGNQTVSGIKTFIGNHIISGNTIVSGSINISGNYDIYSQIENVKKLAIAYAIAL
jgi:hypothetical protein